MNKKSASIISLPSVGRGKHNNYYVTKFKILPNFEDLIIITYCYFKNEIQYNKKQPKSNFETFQIDYENVVQRATRMA